MIPIRDTLRSKNYPIVNGTLIGLNVLVFLIELLQGRNLEPFIYTYGLVPARYSLPDIAVHFSFSQQLLALFSFMFLHGGFWHLIGNMWSLYIFGDNVEDRLGHFRYLLFYLLCGWVSGLAHLLLNWHSAMPTIGASGAIAGIMGGYFILYPKSKILTLIPILIIPFFFEIPAFVFLGLWFLMQFVSAAGATAHSSGIAWWAHIGGFIGGILLLKLFLKMPEMGLTAKVRNKTIKSKTPHLQVIRVMGPAAEPHLYGNIHITAAEARLGGRKLVNLPLGFQKRFLRVTIPPGVHPGMVLRLEGMGRQTADGERGDLYLKVVLTNEADSG